MQASKPNGGTSEIEELYARLHGYEQDNWHVSGHSRGYEMAPMSILVSNKFAVTGKVTFNVTNQSKTMIHEMLVAPIKDEKTELAYFKTENRVDEVKAAVMDCSKI